MNCRVLRCLFALMVFSLASAAYAQNVTNVDANQEGNAIAITYDLKERSDIKLFVTDDNGRTRSSVPSEFLSGDSGKGVAPGVGLKIVWRVLDQYPDQSFVRDNLSFIVESSNVQKEKIAKPSTVSRVFTLVNAGYSLDSGPNAGFTLGQVGKIGWYGKVMSTFAVPRHISYECNESGYINGVMPVYTGMVSKFKTYGVAGVTVGLGGPVYLQAGAGGGLRWYDWELDGGKWVRNTPGSYIGLAIDAGIMTRINRTVLSAGATYLCGSFDISVGVGFLF